MARNPQNRTVDGQAVCPYYQRTYETDRFSVSCEGASEDSCSTKLEFRSRRKWAVYLKTYCCGDYKGCLVCRMLDAKYE